MKKTDRQPAICLDLKWSRLRIHRETLLLLGKPKYIEILVSPKNKGVIIRAATGGKNSHIVNSKQLEDKQCYELHSRDFFREIQKITNILDSSNSYRIKGGLNSEGTAACFSLNDATLLNPGKETSSYA